MQVCACRIGACGPDRQVRRRHSRFPGPCLGPISPTAAPARKERSRAVEGARKKEKTGQLPSTTTTQGTATMVWTFIHCACSQQRHQRYFDFLFSSVLLARALVPLHEQASGAATLSNERRPCLATMLGTRPNSDCATFVGGPLGTFQAIEPNPAWPHRFTRSSMSLAGCQHTRLPGGKTPPKNRALERGTTPTNNQRQNGNTRE